MQYILKEPSLGYVLQNIKILITYNVKTAATDGEQIYISSIFINNLNQEKIIFILLHELLHIVLYHPSRANNYNTKIYNYAHDIVVNDIIKSYCYKEGTLSPITKLFDIDGTINTAEEIYDFIKDKIIDIKILDSHIHFGIK